MCCSAHPLTLGEQAGKHLFSLLFIADANLSTNEQFLNVSTLISRRSMAMARKLTDGTGGIGYYESKVKTIPLGNGELAYYQPPQEGERGDDAHRFEFDIFKVRRRFETLESLA
jgi:hypothetical protein